MNIIAETDRLLLRDLEDEDLPYLVDQFTDPSVRDKILITQSNEGFVRWYFKLAGQASKQVPRTDYVLAVVLKAERAVIGTCDLWYASTNSTNAKLGFGIRSKYMGKGFATEAAAQLIEIGFEKNNVDRIFSDCFSDNSSGIRVIEKLGMNRTESGVLSRLRRARLYGEKRPIVRYEIWRNEWRQLD